MSKDTPSAMDRFAQRRAIEVFVDQIAAQVEGTVLDVGCGDQPHRAALEVASTRYVGLDLVPTRYQRPDVVYDGRSIPVGTGRVDAALATEVLEHVADPSPLLREIYRVLRPGGRLHLTVPFLWPLHDVPDDMYRYTPFALERVLHEAGFVDVDLEAMGGWDASLAQMLALWARRRPMRRWVRSIVSWTLFPIVRGLLRGDAPPAEFRESVMITGLSGSARRPPAADNPDRRSPS